MADEINLLETARRARIDGDYGAAELACRTLLDVDPVHPLASGFLGQCLAEQGNLKAAADLIDLALSLAPMSADVRLNAAALRERNGDLDGAVTAARAATELAPGKFDAFATLGNLLGKSGDFKSSLAALERACTINPRHAGAALLLAGAAMETGAHDRVAAALDIADAAAPGLPQTARMRAMLMRRAQDWPGLVKAATNWLAAAPSEDEAKMALAHGLGQMGFYETASQAYRSIIEREPPAAEHLAAMGRYRLGARNMSEAQSWFERALEVDPKCVEAQFGLSRLFAYVGRIEEAQAACRRALACDPSHVESYGQLAEISAGDLSDAEIEQLRALAAADSLRPEKRSIAEFALGEAFHQRGRSKDAFAAWSAANAFKRQQAAASPQGAYDPAKQENLVRAVLTLFPRDPTPMRAEREASGEPTPIFIVGMPRSGATLLESAISAHPRVNGGGELPAFPHFLREFLAWAEHASFKGGSIPQPRLDDWRARYLKQVAEFGLMGADFVTDKQPVNFLCLGLIRAVFPESPIIHIRRSPIETGLSIFRRNVSHQWPFADDLKAIGHYYGQYAQVMAHWSRGYRGALSSVQYEALAADFERHVRRALEYCDIDWDPACLEFHAAERPVVAYSAAQVRKPVSAERLNAAAPYAEELAPLRRALEAARVDPSTGALLFA